MRSTRLCLLGSMLVIPLVAAADCDMKGAADRTRGAKPKVIATFSVLGGLRYGMRETA